MELKLDACAEQKKNFQVKATYDYVVTVQKINVGAVSLVLLVQV